ncbi:MAG: four helix bundle protein [Verrucomicrobiota bacterium]|nr:four helix bundle protein [Verrucomicrobiota bacterium]
MKTNFEKLRIYKLAEDLADLIWNVVVHWDRFAKETVGRQIVHVADSVGANIAEGTGRGSFQDNKRFAKMARGSLNETQHFLRRAFRRNLLTATDVKKLKPLVDNLAPQLNSYINSIGAAAGTD